MRFTGLLFPARSTKNCKACLSSWIYTSVALLCCPPTVRFKYAMPLHVSRCHIASRLQLRLTIQSGICKPAAHPCRAPRGCNCTSQTRKVCSPSIQTSRQGKMRAEAGCGLRRGRLVPRFRLASRSAASAGIPRGCNAAPRFTLPHNFAQSTFHSRMSDVACSLTQVWTVQTICQHHQYRPMAHRLHCLSSWKVFFLTERFSRPATHLRRRTAHKKSDGRKNPTIALSVVGRRIELLLRD